MAYMSPEAISNTVHHLMSGEHLSYDYEIRVYEKGLFSKVARVAILHRTSQIEIFSTNWTETNDYREMDRYPSLYVGRREGLKSRITAAVRMYEREKTEAEKPENLVLNTETYNID